ncbi:unnamed protein product [Amoebophrya sp. A120]|nr:unnamed protein product [Amoebophrya sp. A120]|eukprot:GSA120T00002373001.1
MIMGRLSGVALSDDAARRALRGLAVETAEMAERMPRRMAPVHSRRPCSSRAHTSKSLPLCGPCVWPVRH